jgi:hypothetical protein
MPGHCSVRWVQGAALVSLALLLVACEHALPALKLLTPLHLPGVSVIPGSTNLGEITAIAAYVPAAEGTTGPHVLFTVNRDLYDVGLDGSDLRPLRLRQPCSSPISVTPNGQWAACQTTSGIELISLTTSSSDGSQLIVPNPDPSGIVDLAWAPDSRHLAASTCATGGPLAIYTVSPGYHSIQLAARLPIGPPLTIDLGVSTCPVFDVSWSPDGAWLTFTTNTDRPTLYAVRLAEIVPHILSAVTSPISVIVSPDLLIRLGGTDHRTPPTWSTVSGQRAVTFVPADTDQEGIARIDITTRKQTTLLRVNEGSIDAPAWTPDSRHLVFALGQHPVYPECEAAFTPSHLYVYTPAG